jgi:hypothetical protein
MKKSKRNKLLGLALVGSFGLFSASNVFAAAGTTIANTATLSYEVGGSAQTDIDASTDFVEDRVINFTVTRQGSAATPVGPDATDQVVGFTLVNLGNSTQDFLLRAENSTANDPFPPSGPDTFLPDTFRAYRDVAPLGVFDPNDELVRTVTNLPPTISTTIWLVADMPDATGVNQGDISTVSLVVRAARASTASGFLTPDAPVLPGETAGAGEAADAFIQDNNGNFDAAGDFQVASGGVATVPAGDATSDKADDPALVETVFFTGSAEASDINSFAMQIASLTVTKSAVAIWDPINFGDNPKSFDGSYVRYTITISNATGAGDADLTNMVDTLDGTLALDPDYVNGSDAVDPPVASDSASGESFEVTHFDSGGVQDEQNYCTSSTGDTDGCGITGQDIAIDISVVLTNATLQADESVTISYNAIYTP